MLFHDNTFSTRKITVISNPAQLVEEGKRESKRVALTVSSSSTARISSSMLSRNLSLSHFGCHPSAYAFAGTISPLIQSPIIRYYVPCFVLMLVKNRKCLPSGRHSSYVLKREPEILGCHLVAGPDLCFWLRHKPTRMKS
jgi:hypothetical protein